MGPLRGRLVVFLTGLALGAALVLATPALRAARSGAQLRRAREVLAEYELPAWP
ncbi:hypothetical protein ABT095_22660 [Kitasatospora sp. NPDC002227]|uniref:hypothetical protein n=1 Tax=Kitasatospora sp. NPDC002227 TaxID=3154773 RepID=UPI003332BFE7